MEENMNSQTWTRIIALMLFAAVAIPVQLAAQDNQDHHHRPHHYTLIDMGTFGGPQSYAFPSFGVTDDRVLNNHGTLAGFADTATTDPFPNFCFNQDCYVSHAFQWKDGAVNDLGVLPGGSSSASTFISASGLIAGFSQNGKIDPLFPGFPESRAVLWSHGKIRNLGTLEGGHESAANALNSEGQVVGGALNTIPDSNAMTLSIGLGNYFPPIPYQVRAFLWQQGVMQDLGTLPGGTDAQAVLINEAGQVAGWSYTSSAPSAVCAAEGFPLTTGSFLWDRESGMVNLGTLGGSCTLAGNLNSRGQVSGVSYITGDTYQHAFLWDDKKIRDLGDSFGGNMAGTSAMNDRAQVVGWATFPGDITFHAALWKHVGKTTDLGTVGNDACSFAGEINAKTQVVGVSKFTCDPESGTRAFLWERGSIFDLNILIPHGSTLYLQSAYAINDQSEIGGQGVDGNGNQHAFLLIPCDENHPGVEGCDYSMVDAALAQTAASSHLPSATSQTSQTRTINRSHVRGSRRPIR
jgi:probable HAF family extracellular repeat protein